MQPKPTAVTSKGPSLRVWWCRAPKVVIEAMSLCSLPPPQLRLLVPGTAQSRKHAADVALEDLLLVGGGQRAAVDVALGVVVIVTGLRIDAAHRAHHFGCEQDVVD